MLLGCCKNPRSSIPALAASAGHPLQGVPRVPHDAWAMCPADAEGSSSGIQDEDMLKHQEILTDTYSRFIIYI